MGPLSASCSYLPALWFLFLCFLPPHQFYPSLCFFQFLLWKQNPILLFFSLSPHSVSAAKSDRGFISSYLLCLALRTAFGIRHLTWRWKKMSRLFKISPLDFPDTPTLPNTTGADSPLWQHFLICVLSSQATEEHRPPSIPQTRLLFFSPRLLPCGNVMVWENINTQNADCTCFLSTMKRPLIILHPPIFPLSLLQRSCSYNFWGVSVGGD